MDAMDMHGNECQSALEGTPCGDAERYTIYRTSSPGLASHTDEVCGSTPRQAHADHLHITSGSECDPYSKVLWSPSGIWTPQVEIASCSQSPGNTPQMWEQFKVIPEEKSNPAQYIFLSHLVTSK
jgi:hypothetical protein